MIIPGAGTCIVKIASVHGISGKRIVLRPPETQITEILIERTLIAKIAIPHVHGLVQIFASGIRDAVIEVFRPDPLFPNKIAESSFVSLKGLTRTQINFGDPFLPFLFRKLFAPPKIFLVLLVDRAETVLTIPTIE